MLDQNLVFVDLETTGASPAYSRITEIAIVEVSNGALVGEWSSLVNPQCRIPDFIETMTGISNEMVQQAPTFAELAPEVLERLAGRLFVAHNARFDYGFLRGELRRQNLRLQEKVLCTVKLSRRLWPEQRTHSLDALMERHRLPCEARHRALGDARLLWHFVQRLYQMLPPQQLHAAAAAAVVYPMRPLHFAEELLDAVPEAPGVYRLYGEGGALLFIDTSSNLRTRVLAHFSGERSSGLQARLRDQIHGLDWVETAGELGALLKEAQLIRRGVPAHNRKVRDAGELWTLHMRPAPPDVYQSLRRVRADEIDQRHIGQYYGLFRHKRDADKALRGLADKHRLCYRLLELEQTPGGCSAYHTGGCQGACVAREPGVRHNLRFA